MPTSARLRSGLLPALTLLFCLAVTIGIGQWWETPPQAKWSDAPLDQFSAARALTHVTTIAREPHPAGSLTNKRARDYLIATLRGYGLQVEIQRELAANRYTRTGIGATYASVENIIAVLKGSSPEKALLLMAHYDSEPLTPGAADNASGVATVLETVRALARDGSPRRDVVVLFSDAEEVGLLGSQAFFDRNPLASRIGMVLNFDARGSSGPAFMFQTSSGGAALIDALASNVKHANASSLMQAIYGHMPNYTDLSISTEAGLPGMNFAFIDGLFDYHGPTDKVGNLSPDSVQHLGEYALPLARHFANAELPPLSSPPGSFFALPNHRIIHYPPWADQFALAVCAMLIGFYLLRARRSGQLTLTATARGTGVGLLVLLAPTLVLYVLHQAVLGSLGGSASLLKVLAQERGWFIAWTALALGCALCLMGQARHGLKWPHAIAIGAALALLPLVRGELSLPALIGGATVAALLVLMLRQPLQTEPLIAGALLAFLFVAMIVAAALGGALHALVWPLLVIAALHAWSWRKTGASAGAAWFVAGLPAAIMLGGTAFLLNIAVGYALPSVSAVPLLLVLLLMAPPALRGSPRAIGLTVSAVALTWIAILALRDPFDSRHPRPTSLFVLQDADTGASYWASTDRQMTPWHHTTLGTSPEALHGTVYFPPYRNATRVVRNDLEISSIPHLSQTSLSNEGGVRRVKARLSADHCSDQLRVFVPPHSGLRSWRVEGQELPAPMGNTPWWSTLSGFAIPPGGVGIELDFESDKPLPVVSVTNVCHSLPPGTSLPPRPQNQMPRPYANSDSTVVTRTFALEDMTGS